MPQRTGHASIPTSVSGRALWLVVLAVIVSVAALAAVSVRVLERGPTPPFLNGVAAPPRPLLPERSKDVLHIAGSGSNVPLTRRLAEAFTSRRGHAVVVHKSIGSHGGIRAVVDGAIDLGMVSREVRPEEGEGVVVVPYARAAVLVAAHASVPDTGITRNQLLDVFRGVQTVWSDGSRLFVLQRERGDSSHKAVAAVIPGFEQANEEAYRDDRFRVIYRDADMHEALATTRGAIGLYGLGEIPDDVPVRALRVDGVEPSAESLADGRYPFAKDLALISSGSPEGLAADFVEFVHSPDGEKIIVDSGYMPIGKGRAP